MPKVLFYHWDWKEQPDVTKIQQAVDAVFDGSHAPRIVDTVPTADWDQITVAITSEPVMPDVIGNLFLQHLDSDHMCWWDEMNAPKPLEIA